MVACIESDRATQRDKTEAGPAFAALPTSEAWPRSGGSCLPPTAIRVLADVDKNGTADHVVTVRVSVDDVNQNGRFDLGTDRLVFAPDQLERIDRAAPLMFGPSDWRDAVRKAAASL